MDLQKLLELLELDEPQEFEYFENFADLVENDDEVPADVLCELFSQVEPEAVSEIIGNYFDDALEALPDSATDVYVLMDSIKKALMGLIRAADDDDSVQYFCDELHKFKQWFSFESEVTCTDRESGKEKTLPVRDALTLSRLEKLGHESYDYDFSECLDYELDEYAVDFSDLAEEDVPESEDPLDNGFVLDENQPDE